MIPYHDENQTQRTPIVTMVLIAMSVLSWMLLQGAGSTLPLVTSVCNLGLIPAELTLSRPPGTGIPLGDGFDCVIDPGRQTYTVFSSMFLHGSWMHLIGNMWFLWLFGNNIEDSMSRPRFVLFYLLSGIGAALAQVAADPGSGVPMVGASGAISGVMGAYLVLFPRVRVFTIVPLGFYVTTVALPAWVMLVYWTLLQVVGGIGSTFSEQAGGVAFWAHLGGFLSGVILIKLFEGENRVAAHRADRWRPRPSRS